MAPQEHKYHDELRRLALTITRVNDCAMALVARVIHICRPKIVSRIRRLKKCIVPGLPVFEDATGAFRDHLVEKMPHMFPEPENLSCKTFALRYLSRVSTISNATCTENTLEKLIRFAFVIGSYDNLKSIIHDETVIRRIRKLGGYYSATKWIAGTVKRLEDRSPRYTTANVTFREVRHQPYYHASSSLTPRTGAPTSAIRYQHFYHPHRHSQQLRRDLRPWPCHPGLTYSGVSSRLDWRKRQGAEPAGHTPSMPSARLPCTL